jgi:predicted nuclease of restriction endonuclease-like (RecB) superfamily
MNKGHLPVGQEQYNELLRQAVAVIDETRQTIARQVNNGVTSAYWELGKLLHTRKLESEHGNSIVNKLSDDLKAHYPQMGLSPRNLWDMKKFFERFHTSSLKLRQAVAVLPWGHILLLMQKIKDDEAIWYYANETIAKGWSRSLLLNAIKLDMFGNQSPATVDNNFKKVLPTVQAMYANEVFKSTYNLGFLEVTDPILELELERRLVAKITTFLLELGKGFTFIGNQHTLEYNGKESKVDMLFFHRGLKCLVAIDLKIGNFIPEYAGKMNYYLSLLDRLERGEGENRSVGIILCAEKDHVAVELALEDMGKPIGVADYQLILPKKQLENIVKDEIRAFREENIEDHGDTE